MGRNHVDHADIVRFADERINLKRDDATDLRKQVWGLRDRLEAYLKDHPDFDLRRMLLAGSLAKGTALKSINDIDVAVYVSSEHAPEKVGELIDWLAVRLRTAFPNFKPEQVKPNKFSVTVSFIASGLNVDVVPILCDNDSDGKGYLVVRDTGETILTNIDWHLEFIRARKKANDIHYAQVVRLLKYWVRQRRAENEQFRFKSFMIELLVAHLADAGLTLNDYPEALAEIFNHIAVDSFNTPIAFSDYYDPKKCETTDHAIRIWDPVNHENNVAKLYTEEQRALIVQEALGAGDAIDSALRAQTKGETTRYWQKVLGTSFGA
jgi:tRNA nucleotidyltransferase (CCA-adding enzyme)